MPYQTPSLDGEPVFGLVISSKPNPIPIARQITEFFGINGRFSSFAGTRGRRFTIRAVFEEETIPEINEDFAALEAFIGPGLHTYIDTAGNTYYNCIFDGEIDYDGEFLPTDIGWCRGYSLQFQSLTL